MRQIPPMSKVKVHPEFGIMHYKKTGDKFSACGKRGAITSTGQWEWPGGGLGINCCECLKHKPKDFKTPIYGKNNITKKQIKQILSQVRVMHFARMGDNFTACGKLANCVTHTGRWRWEGGLLKVNCPACLRYKEKYPDLYLHKENRKGNSKKGKVVHCRKEPYDVYIGRGGKWGNPFKIGKDGTRKEVIQKYEEYLKSSKELMAELPELKDKVLGCWCVPKRCHGTILLKYIERANK